MTQCAVRRTSRVLETWREGDGPWSGRGIAALNKSKDELQGSGRRGLGGRLAWGGRETSETGTEQRISTNSDGLYESVC